MYIGSSNNIERRWKEHKKKLKFNKHWNIHLQNAWNSYGSNSFNFIVLQLVNNNLIEIESKWIEKLDSKNNGYNILEPRQIKIGRSTTEEHKRKISESLKEYYKINGHHAKGIKRNNIRKNNIGGKIIEVYKDNILIEEYPSIAECSRQMNISKNCIQECCIGKIYGTNKRRLSYKGYKFKYKLKLIW